MRKIAKFILKNMRKIAFSGNEKMYLKVCLSLSFKEMTKCKQKK